jgi:hypothetical protein
MLMKSTSYIRATAESEEIASNTKQGRENLRKIMACTLSKYGTHALRYYEEL